LKKTLSVLVVLGLVVGAFVAVPAEAKKKKKLKAVETTLYMHGVTPLGEVDGAQWLADGNGPVSPLTMTPEEPAAGPPKSMNFFNPALNDQCTGLPLAFPTFTGNLSGTITGDATVKAHFASAPGQLLARIWADMGAFVGCNEAYVEPASEVTVDVPPGHNEVEIKFPGLNLPAQQTFMIEILAPSGTGYKGQLGRLLYDSADTPTSITFNCIPAAGASCTP
jgi:hypothetical protein